MVSYDLLKDKKNEFGLERLPVERTRSRGSQKILDLLKKESLTTDEIKAKLGLKGNAAYNFVRRLEKKNQVVAFDFEGKIVYAEKKKAEKVGLI